MTIILTLQSYLIVQFVNMQVCTLVTLPICKVVKTFPTFTITNNPV